MIDYLHVLHYFGRYPYTECPPLAKLHPSWLAIETSLLFTEIMTPVQSLCTFHWAQKHTVERMSFEKKRSYRWYWGEDVPSVAVSVAAFLPPLSVRQNAYLRVLIFLKLVTFHCGGFVTKPDPKKTLFPMLPRTRYPAGRPIALCKESANNTTWPSSAINMALEVQTTKQTLNAM